MTETSTKKTPQALKKAKRVRILATAGGLSAMAAGVAAIAASCGTVEGNPKQFVSISSSDLLQNNSSPLNPGFSSAPNDSITNAAMVALLTYETTGQIKVDSQNNLTQSSTDTLLLEGATRLDAYSETTGADGKTAETLLGYFLKDDGDVTGNWHSPDGKGTVSYQSVVESATRYKFSIDHKIKWITSDGQLATSDLNPSASLSGKDFERGLETYALAAAIAYNNNSYFLDLMGLDATKTLNSHDPNASKYTSWADAFYNVDYDTTDFTATDDEFSIYLQSPYPYALSLLTKGYFYAVPWYNPKVQNIKLGRLADGSPSPIVVDNNFYIDNDNTNFDQIYGSGTLGVFLGNTWFNGAYRIQAFTDSQVLYTLNDDYLDAMTNLQNPKDRHIPSYLINYGSSTVGEVLYQNYIGGQVSTASVPTTQYADAIARYGNTNELQPAKTLSTTQSSYLVYTPKPYLPNTDKTSDGYGKLSVNAYIEAPMANLIYHQESRESTIFRASLAGLIDHKYLSQIVYASGDFEMSAVPYGVFRYHRSAVQHVENTTDGATEEEKKANESGFTVPADEPQVEYYQDVANGNGYGGLPRPFADYTGNAQLMPSGFTLYYYSYGGGGYKQEQIQVDQARFRQSLQYYSGGASVNYQAKVGEGTLGPQNTDYYNKLEQSINTLNGPAGHYNNNMTAAANPTSTQWFSTQASPIGFQFWSPDYNGVGTWLEAGGTMDDQTIPISSGAFSFPSAFKNMMIAAKDLNATVTAQGASYTTPTEGSAKSVYDGDPRIEKIWGVGNAYKFSMLGVNFLDYLIKQGVINGDSVAKLLQGSGLTGVIKTLSDLDQNDSAAPTTNQQLYRFQPFFLQTGANKAGDPTYSSAIYGTKMGVYAGYNDANAMFLATVSDLDYNFLPLRAAGLREVSLSLVKPQFISRTSSVTTTDIRDMGLSDLAFE